MKLLSFKDKQRAFAAGEKMKETDFGITEAYSHKIGFEIKQMFYFALKAGGDIKLRLNKLSINYKAFVFDNASNAVTALNK